jgi:hypothetical protein
MLLTRRDVVGLRYELAHPTARSTRSDLLAEPRLLLASSQLTRSVISRVPLGRPRAMPRQASNLQARRVDSQKGAVL